VSVFFISIAIVIGPTPPGTGVSAEATSLTASYIAVADEAITALARAVIHAVDADVDDDGAGLDHVGRHEVGATDRSHEDIGLAGHRSRGPWSASGRP
jgi:hypothetical protein